MRILQTFDKMRRTTHIPQETQSRMQMMPIMTAGVKYATSKFLSCCAMRSPSFVFCNSYAERDFRKGE